MFEVAVSLWAPSEPPRARGAEVAPVPRLDEPHPLVHRRERRLRRFARLLGADREETLQLPLVGPQRVVALLDRHEQLHDCLADVLLELSIACAVVPRL